MVVGVMEKSLVPVKPNIPINNGKQGVEQICIGFLELKSKGIPVILTVKNPTGQVEEKDTKRAT